MVGGNPSSQGRSDVDPIKSIIYQLWSEHFPGTTLQSDSSFFELGGHSLLAVKVTTRLYAALGVKISIRILFENPHLDDFISAVRAVVLAKHESSGI